MFIDERNKEQDNVRYKFYTKYPLFVNLSQEERKKLLIRFHLWNIPYDPDINERYDRNEKNRNESRNISNMYDKIKPLEDELTYLKSKDPPKTKDARFKKAKQMTELENKIKQLETEQKLRREALNKKEEDERVKYTKLYEEREPLRILDNKRSLIIEILEDIPKLKQSLNLNPAATKIQSLFRMRKAQKELKKLKEEKKAKEQKKLEDLTLTQKTIIYNAIYIAPYEYRSRFEKIIPRIQPENKGTIFTFRQLPQDKFKDPDQLVKPLENILNGIDLDKNVKNLLY
jgi:hypothetical protein